jgi:hypothetical protein
VIRPEQHDLNILPSRFVFAGKYFEDGTEKIKARLVTGGQRDRLKDQHVHISNTFGKAHVRMQMALASIFDNNVWSSDVKQAYLQSSVPSLKDGFVRTDGMDFGQKELAKLLKPLHVLSVSGDYWAKTLSYFHTQQLRFEQATSEFSCFFRRVPNKLIGLSSSFVDDWIQACTP